MKKEPKIAAALPDQNVTITVDESLDKLKGKILAPHKLEHANRSLRKMKSLAK